MNDLDKLSRAFDRGAHTGGARASRKAAVRTNYIGRYSDWHVRWTSCHGIEDERSIYLAHKCGKPVDAVKQGLYLTELCWLKDKRLNQDLPRPTWHRPRENIEDDEYDNVINKGGNHPELQETIMDTLHVGLS